MKRASGKQDCRSDPGFHPARRQTVRSQASSGPELTDVRSVICRRSDGSEPSPLYARQRTSSGRPGMSAWCQSRRRIRRRRYPLLVVKPPSGSFFFVRVTSAMSESVKVFGCRPHDGGAAHTGAGVRKPPREETAGGVARWRVRRYGDFGAGGLLPTGVERLLGKRSRGRRPQSADRDRQNRCRAAQIDRRGGCPGRRDGEHGHCWSRAGEAEVQH